MNIVGILRWAFYIYCLGALSTYMKLACYFSFEILDAVFSTRAVHGSEDPPPPDISSWPHA